MYLMCRLCLEDKGSLELIFGIGKSLISTITDNLFEINDVDGWPTGICEDCKCKLKKATDFFNVCKNSNKFLMEHLGETSILQKTNISNNSIQKSSKIDDPEHISDTTDNESLLEELIIPNKQKVNEKFYRCSNCQKTFNSRGSLARHMRVHVRETSENSFRCTDCKKPFKYKGSLESHLLIHHSNKMDRTIADVRKIKNLILFECFTCHKILKSRYRLNLHKLVHSDKRQFQCELCKKTFKTKSSLYQHKQIHRNERKFKCDTCGNSFNFKCHLIRHFQVHKNLT